VSDAAGTTASAFDTPPLSVDGLRQTIQETRQAVSEINPTKVLPKAEMARLWDDMYQIAATQGVNPIAVSGAVTLYSLNKIGAFGRGALSTVTAAGTLFDRHVIDHYQEAVTSIYRKGIYTCLAESSKPYIDSVWYNFSSNRDTITEGILTGRTIGKAWKAVRRWLGGGDEGVASTE
jgi:hypothetical protein